MHRPFDGAFPANYPADLAVRQCTEVACRLLVYPSNSARDRAHTMLYMAEGGLHSFDYDSGRWVNAELERAGLDEDAKHTFIMKLHPHPSVGQLLLQRCGKSSKWLTGNGARSLSRLMRHYEFSPAFTRNLVERLGNNPDTLLHDRSRLPDTGAVQRSKRPVHPSVAANWVHHPEHRNRLVDVGRAARRTPPAQTK